MTIRFNSLGHRKLVLRHILNYTKTLLLLLLLLSYLFIITEEVDFVFFREHSETLIFLEEQVVKSSGGIVLVLEKTSLCIFFSDRELFFQNADDLSIDGDCIDSDNYALVNSAIWRRNLVEPSVSPDIFYSVPLHWVRAQNAFQ